MVLVVGIWFEVVSIERSGDSLARSLRRLLLILAVGRAGSGDGSPSPIHLLSSRMTLTVVQRVFGESGLFRCCGSVPAPPYGFGF